MKKTLFEIDPVKPFSESLIWEINRKYYQKTGVDAWRSGVVPHHMTSNSMVGKTYAELIYAFLKDLAAKGQTQEKVYILELGAGHGRLAFHILKHLEQLKSRLDLVLPPYCYILSDIVEDSLGFFFDHPQFQTYFEQGLLDVSYFDAVKSKEIILRYSKETLSVYALKQPIIAIANYFFDSIPNDLFYIKNKVVSACEISLASEIDPEKMDEQTLLKNLQCTYHKTKIDFPHYENEILNEVLEAYKDLLLNTYLFFPRTSLECIDNLRQLSEKGLMVLSIDKGFVDISDLENEGEPDLVKHGSFSLWVNFHAYKQFCEKHNGKALFPSFSTFYLQLACLQFLPDTENYKETEMTYHRFVNDFGPDDFNGLKRMTYQNMARMSLIELIAILRLSAYDSTMFENMLSRLKQVSRKVTVKERHRLAQTMHQIWNMYFSIKEPFDLAYELGGIFYDLGYYEEAIDYFQHSLKAYGEKPDIYYNKALCYYQLRKDSLFTETLELGKKAFPNFERFVELDKLDLGAA